MNIIRRILRARGLEAPDGRPLYAYKVTDDEFSELGRDLIAELRAWGTISPRTAPAFCLFVAEFFSRGDGSDWWTWDGVKHVLAFAAPDQYLRDAVDVGLRFLRRPVLRGGRGNEYLATLVSEGGLPLALLQQEGGRLRRYFGDLLRDHETYPTLDVTQRAHDLREPLAVRMRNEIVYELAARIVREVARVRAAGGAVGEWDLPLRLDHGAARELIEGLRSEPKVVPRVERGVAVRTLLQLGGELLLRRMLVLPPRLSEQWFQRALNCREVPSRLYLSLQTAEGARQTIGVATLQGDHYLVTSTASRDLVRSAATTEQLRCVVSFSGADLGSFVPQGGEALTNTPWSFDTEAAGARLRGMGTYRSPASALLIALPADGKVGVDGEVEEVGTLVGHERRMVRLRGTLRWQDAHEEVTVTTGVNDVGDGDFELRGDRPSSLIQEPDLWLGRPDVLQVTQGVLRSLPAEQLAWRKLGAPWSADLRGALGEGELGVRRTDIEFRARVRILPRDFQIGIRCVARDRGVIEVRSAALAAAGVAPAPEVQSDVHRVSGGFDVHVVARQAVPPSVVRVMTKMNTGADLSLTVPFPAEQAAFVSRNGTALPRDAEISLDELAHLRAVVISPQDGIWALDARGERGSSRLAKLRELAHGVREMSLEPLRTVLSAMLASDASLDHHVTLQLVREGLVGRPPPTCHVRRYDATLIPTTNEGRRDVVLDPTAMAALGPEVVSALRAEAVPLKRPDRPAVALVRTQPGRWSVDDANLEPGLWLVFAYQNDYLRTRPLRITVPDLTPVASQDQSGHAPRREAPVSDFERAVVERHPDSRRRLLDLALQNLGDDTSVDEWELVRAQLATLGRYPATTFDVARAATRHPRIAVLVLLEAGARQQLVWNGFEELPFLWVTTPVAVWLDAVHGSLRALREKLPASIPLESVLLAGAPGVFGPDKLALFLECIHDAAFLRDPGIPEPTQRPVFRSAEMREVYLNMLSDEMSKLIARHLDGFWPEAPPWEASPASPELAPLTRAFEAQPSFQRVVLEAPLVLAERSVLGDTSCDLPCLRHVRDFDLDWFDLAYALGLSLLLGGRFNRKEPPFHD
jgi:hypothetical protein